MWQQAVKDWTAYLSVTDHAEKTIREYRRTLVNFLADTLLELSEVTQDDIVTYVAALPRNGSQRGAVLRAWRSFGEFGRVRHLHRKRIAVDEASPPPEGERHG